MMTLPKLPLALPPPAWRLAQTEESRREACRIIREASDGELLDLLSSQEILTSAHATGEKAVWCGGKIVGWKQHSGSPVRYMRYDQCGDLYDSAERVLDWIKTRIVDRFREQRHQRQMAAIRSRVKRKYAPKIARRAA